MRVTGPVTCSQCVGRLVCDFLVVCWEIERAGQRTDPAVAGGESVHMEAHGEREGAHGSQSRSPALPRLSWLVSASRSDVGTPLCVGSATA